MDFVREEERDLKNIFNRFRRRDFSGDTGQAIKNSSYQFVQNLIFKIGSLIFTILIARLLLPERMGLYSLALSTIVLIASFTDLGIGSAIITYVSKLVGKGKNSKAKGYVKKLFEWKFSLQVICALVLLSLSYYLSNSYYQKPIFYALLVGGLYLLSYPLLGFLESVFKSINNFRVPLEKEVVFQVLRLILVPLGILWFVSIGLSDEIIVALTILALAIVSVISFLYLAFKAKKKVSFLKGKSTPLEKKEVKDLKKFLIPLSATALAGMFFGYIDIFMLGHYVGSEYIAYYGAALSLVGGAAAIIGFMSQSMLPIFASKKGDSLKEMFRKSRNFIVLLSFFSAIVTYFVSYYVVRVAYGIEYLQAVPVLQFFSVMVFLLPVLGIYTTYYTSQKRTKTLAWIVSLTAVLNIIFNYFGITYGLNNFGEMGALYGAATATITSRIVYLIGMVGFKNKRK